MSEQDKSNAGRKPTTIAYTQREASDGNTYWNKIGVAWEHRDGQGLEIVLDSLPINGRITLRDMRDERMQAYEEERQAQGMDQQHNERGKSRGRNRSR